MEPRWNKIAWTYLQLPMMVVLGALSKREPGNNACLKIEYFLLMTWKRSTIIEVNDWTVNKSGKNNGKFWSTWSSQSPQFQILGIIRDSSLFGLSATNKISQSRGVAFGFARTAFFVVLTLHLPGPFFQKWPSIFASFVLTEKKVIYSKFLKLVILFFNSN